jgi:hypothetical protein
MLDVFLQHIHAAAVGEVVVAENEIVGGGVDGHRLLEGANAGDAPLAEVVFQRFAHQVQLVLIILDYQQLQHRHRLSLHPQSDLKPSTICFRHRTIIEPHPLPPALVWRQVVIGVLMNLHPVICAIQHRSDELLGIGGL